MIKHDGSRKMKHIYGLSPVRQQGQIIEREKRNVRQYNRLSASDALQWFADMYDLFKKDIDETESLYRQERVSKMIELEKRIRALNQDPQGRAENI